MARTTAQVHGATLVCSTNEASPIEANTPACFRWLEQATTFTFTSPRGHFTARKERQARGNGYWKAYRSAQGRLHRVYLGKAQDLTLDRLNEAAAALTCSNHHSSCGSDTTPLAASIPAHLLATKLYVPPARTNLVIRPRLFAQLQAGLREKLTLVAAPAGFGKTILSGCAARSVMPCLGLRQLTRHTETTMLHQIATASSFWIS